MLALLVCILCIPWVSAQGGYTFDVKMIADKTSYTPGSEITYIFPVDLACPADAPRCEIDHCTGGIFTLDPHIEAITQNMNDDRYSGYPYCSINGNLVSCEDNRFMGMWFGIGTLFGRLPVLHGSSGEFLEDFSIRGKIKENTPAGTIITSTSGVGDCSIMASDRIVDVGSISESRVIIVKSESVPEFPSAFLPAIMMIGFLGAVLLIERTREH